MPDQPDKPTHRRLQIPWAAMIVLLIAVYIGGYLALSEESGPITTGNAWGSHVGAEFRAVDFQWMVTVYEPIRIIESAIRGKRVILYRCPTNRLAASSGGSAGASGF